MSDPYSNKPSSLSAADEWHEISFRISVDAEVDWDKVDLRKWAQVVARYTALTMAETTRPQKDLTESEVLKTLIMAVKVDRLHFIDDEGLHNMIDEYDDTGD